MTFSLIVWWKRKKYITKNKIFVSVRKTKRNKVRKCVLRFLFVITSNTHIFANIVMKFVKICYFYTYRQTNFSRMYRLEWNWNLEFWLFFSSEICLFVKIHFHRKWHTFVLGNLCACRTEILLFEQLNEYYL